MEQCVAEMALGDIKSGNYVSDDTMQDVCDYYNMYALRKLIDREYLSENELNVIRQHELVTEVIYMNRSKMYGGSDWFSVILIDDNYFEVYVENNG